MSSQAIPPLHAPNIWHTGTPPHLSLVHNNSYVSTGNEYNLIPPSIHIHVQPVEGTFSLYFSPLDIAGHIEASKFIKHGAGHFSQPPPPPGCSSKLPNQSYEIPPSTATIGGPSITDPAGSGIPSSNSYPLTRACAFDSEKQGTFSAAGPSMECAVDMYFEEGRSSSRNPQAKPSPSSANVELQGVYDIWVFCIFVLGELLSSRTRTMEDYARMMVMLSTLFRPYSSSSLSTKATKAAAAISIVRVQSSLEKEPHQQEEIVVETASSKGAVSEPGTTSSEGTKSPLPEA
ncbi:hypothetical protein L7F22_040191 [Adiantum nelumboides]|nr:hypothetical protein [Adiantum nelumboides]